MAPHLELATICHHGALGTRFSAGGCRPRAVGSMPPPEGPHRDSASRAGFARGPERKTMALSDGHSGSGGSRAGHRVRGRAAEAATAGDGKRRRGRRSLLSVLTKTGFTSCQGSLSKPETRSAPRPSPPEAERDAADARGEAMRIPTSKATTQMASGARHGQPSPSAAAAAASLLGPRAAFSKGRF
jgi:hypothetical protein